MRGQWQNPTAQQTEYDLL